MEEILQKNMYELALHQKELKAKSDDLDMKATKLEEMETLNKSLSE